MTEIEIGNNLLQIALAIVGILGGYVAGHKTCSHNMKKKGNLA